MLERGEEPGSLIIMDPLPRLYEGKKRRREGHLPSLGGVFANAVAFL